MIVIDFSRILFVVLSLILGLFVGGIIVVAIRRRVDYLKYVLAPVIISIVMIIDYSIFLLSKSQKSAVLFDSIYFIGTDWLALCMFFFSILYTGLFKNRLRVLEIIFGSLCLLDSIGLIINNFNNFMFNLVLMQSYTGKMYWGNVFKFPHYIHLGLCYVMVCWTFVNLVVETIKVSSFYKFKYITVLVVYFIVIVVNFVCYSVNLPFDFSVLFYVVLAGFICYYTTLGFPHKLLRKTLMSVNDTVSEGIIYFDYNGYCVYANKNAKKLFSMDSIFCSEVAEDYIETLYSEINDGENIIKKNEEFLVDGENRKYGVEYYIEYVDGYKVGSVARFTDKTEEYNRLEKERYTATHDELTGLLNRRGFCQAVDEYVKIHGCENRAMLCSNIKDFKLINELFGEKTGDAVIKKHADMFRYFSHKNSFYGRIGDDKFALFTDKAFFSEEIFINYISTLQNFIDNTLYKFQVEAGIYETNGKIEPAHMMTDKALLAIDKSHHNYDSVFYYYDSALMEKLLIEKNIVSDFKQAIERDEIQMYLQPVLDKNNHLCGGEALCRWNHPVKGMKYPEEFLSILEKNSLVHILDEYIWEKAVQTLVSWNEKGFKGLYISVNVSIKDFFYTDIVKTFVRLVEVYDVNPENLCIEITETLLMSDFEKAFLLAEKLQNCGFKVAIDNFGNGYSSLNMLKDFKAGYLKIDRAFLKNADDQKRSQIILDAIISMSKSIDMKVIGEGIEKLSQYEVLKQLDCDYYQGNYLYPALSIEQFNQIFFDQKQK